MVLRMP